MKQISVRFLGGLGGAIRSIVLDLFRQVPCRGVNSLDAIDRVPDGAWHLCLRAQRPRGLQGVIAIAIGLLASPAQGQELDAAWFKANYLPAAEKLEQAYGQCTAEVTETVTNDKSDDYNQATYHFAFNGSRRKFDRKIENHKQGSIVGFSRTIVASPEVTFRVLTRREHGPLLESVDRSSMEFAQATESIDRDACDSIYAPFALFEEPVSRSLADKDFEIQEVHREGDRVRLKFSLKKQDFQETGWVDFLPERQWVIDRWEVSRKTVKPPEYTCRLISELSYADGDPVPALSGWTTTTYDPVRTDTDKLVVDKLTFAAAPRSEFKLSRYGYDDRIATPASVGKSLWFWLAITGAICLLTAFGLRMRYRHAV
jgi:hypothetical protein